MDRGARFYRCDFQVHSPRDLNWSGERPVTDEERRDYAREFVRACRRLGLQAVAISDHHDMAFVPYLRTAAREEVDEQGGPIEAHRRLIVFPAMEVTLGIPCQAILIFDAELPDDMFPLALNALAIMPAPHEAAAHAPIQRLDRITDLRQLHAELDRHEFLRGRYIILPNVSEGGGSTLLRHGHAGHYRNMPCVGGYLDGSIAQLGTGNRDILDGRAVDYGNKRLGIFQTSDNRSRDFAALGAHSTWVKWATPTAEALRQACLARESRISQVQPVLPTAWISALEVSNSRFMGPLVVDFNCQHNALIGGRGTGKSTILEYLRWALCDQPPSVAEEEDVPDFQAKRRSLITRTLAELNASVQVRFIINDVEHVVRRHAATNELSIKVGTSDFTQCSEEQVRELFPIQAYSQKQLSNIGIRIDELVRFLKTPVRREIDSATNVIRAAAEQVTSLFRSQLEAIRFQIERGTHQMELDSLSQQAAAIQTSLQELSPEDRALVASQPVYSATENSIAGGKRRAAQLKTLLQATMSALAGYADLMPVPKDSPLAERLTRVQQAFADIVTKLRTQLEVASAAVSALEERGGPLSIVVDEWSNIHGEWKTRFDAAANRAAQHTSLIAQLQTVEQRRAELKATIEELDRTLAQIADIDERLRNAEQVWLQSYDSRTHLLRGQCERIGSLSEDQVRASVKPGGLIDDTLRAFKSALAGSGVRSTKIDALVTYATTQSNPIQSWLHLLRELRDLIASKSASKALTAPIVTEGGLNSSDIAKISERMTSEKWADLALASLDDLPVFEYRVREGEYIPFREASAGQQATALLSMLLRSPGTPLIIDQPEEDLDNQIILRIVEQLWQAKQQRQLLFSSHNANFVVNGDAELVLCCDNRIAGEQSGGIIRYQGAIDIPEIKEEITRVMEGGADAFKLRQQKYGF